MFLHSMEQPPSPTYLPLFQEALLKPTTEVRKTVQLEKVHNAYKPVANHAFNKMHQVSNLVI